MKSLLKSKDREQIAEVIQLMLLDSRPIVSWEVGPDSKRVIFPVKLSKVNNDEEILRFESTVNEPISFNSKHIFFFSEDQKAIFKAQITEADGNAITLNLPDIVKILEDSDQAQYAKMIDTFNQEMQFEAPSLELSLDDDDDELVQDTVKDDWYEATLSQHDISLFKSELSFITIEEEDQKFEQVRSSPRARPPEGKMVTVQPQDESRSQASFILFDLSQGGLSFLVFSKEEFTEGEKVIIKAFDTRRFEEPMEAEVKAIREADDLGIQYKVGCQFIGANPIE